MTKSMSRAIAWVAAGALGVVGLGACSPDTAPEETGASTTQATSGGETTAAETQVSGEIRVFHPYPEAFDVPLPVVAQQYMDANPGTTVTIESAPYDPGGTALTTQFMGGTAQDLILLEPPLLTDFSSRGFLMDLTSELEGEWSESFGPTNVASLRAADGKDYGVPWTVINIKQMANMDVMNELGLEPPTNWTEQQEVDTALADAGILPWWASIKGDDASIWWRFTLFLNAGYRPLTGEINLRHAEGWEYNPDDPNTVAGEAYTADEEYVAFMNGLTDPAKSDVYKEALDFLLMWKGHTGDGMNFQADRQTQMFLEGTLAQRNAQDTDIPGMLASAKEAGLTDFTEESMHIQQFPPLTEEEWPALTAGPTNPLVSVRNAWAVNEASENKALAVDFLRYMTSVEGVDTLYANAVNEDGTSMIGQTSALEGVTYVEGTGLQPETLDTYSELSLYGFGMPPTYDSQDFDEFNSQFQQLWTDAITAEEFLQMRSESNRAALERNLDVFAEEVDQAFIDENVG